MMNTIFWLVWWVLAVVILYHHVFYPLAMSLFAKRSVAVDKPLPQLNEEQLPEIRVVIPCYNEADVIAEKLRNLAFLDYPAQRWSVLIMDDGSTDDTVAIVRRVQQEPELAELNIELIVQPVNQGKVRTVNAAMRRITHSIVVLTDTSALISLDALQRIASHMTDASVGVVCATYDFLYDGNAGERQYWRYQTQVKINESQLGATLGAHGAMYAFRAEDFTPLASDTINDDFILPMTIVQRGLRSVYDTNIVAVELEQATLTMDRSRRQRIAAGNLQQALRLLPLLQPKHGWVALNFASGKWLRAFMPFVLLALALLCVWNPLNSALVSTAAVAQLGVYSVALLRHWLPGLATIKPIEIIYYLVGGYVASFIGGLHYLLFPHHFVRWQRAGQPASAASYVPLATLVLKRSFDVMVALLAILASLPVWPLIALAIKVESRGPVFFKQLRIGRALPDRTELFEMIKFRTMAVDAESKSGAVWAQTNDPRITRTGKFLRKTRLDEIPQLLNVLLGQMSLVGPRPERPGIGRDLDAAIPFYAERTYYVTPGITGLAQVNQGYDTCLEDVKSKLLYDHAYALALSKPSAWFLMDVHVVFKTVWVMVAGRGQ